MKKTHILLSASLLLATAGLALTACAGEADYSSHTAVTFMLQGGQYKNSTNEIVYYYNVAGDTKVSDPNAFTAKDQVTRNGYILEGWYLNVEGEGDNAVYTNKWDFASDVVTKEGVTLYAKWEKEVQYIYNICYKNGSETVKVGSYSANEGDKLNLTLAELQVKRKGYTFLGDFLKEDGTPWDMSFTHTGGEVNVYAEYIEGDYQIVTVAKDLKYASSKNIYLKNDIDMGGEYFSLKNYEKIFKGNGYKIHNFKLKCGTASNGSALASDLETDVLAGVGKSWYVSIFGNPDGATIENVTFENFTVTVASDFSQVQKIYIAPVGVHLKNTQITNVTVSNATLTVGELPAAIEANKAELLVVVTDRAYYQKDEASTVTNFVGGLTEQE